MLDWLREQSGMSDFLPAPKSLEANLGWSRRMNTSSFLCWQGPTKPRNGHASNLGPFEMLLVRNRIWTFSHQTHITYLMCMPAKRLLWWRHKATRHDASLKQPQGTSNEWRPLATWAQWNVLSKVAAQLLAKGQEKRCLQESCCVPHD